MWIDFFYVTGEAVNYGGRGRMGLVWTNVYGFSLSTAHGESIIGPS